MLVDVFIQWKLTSETVMFQNVIALLLFPIFVWYLIQFTHEIKKIHRVCYVLLFPVLIFCVLSIIDYYVLLKYTNPQSLLEHFNALPIWYQLIFKGSQVLFIRTLILLLKALNKYDENLKAAYSTTRW
jgi:hypothetical protein